MNKFTTSAQKTLLLSKDTILKMLEVEMSKDASLVFHNTQRENIKEAKLKDGSKLVIAVFNKENGKTLAMIDHKNIPAGTVRSEIQRKLRQKLNKIFNQ